MDDLNLVLFDTWLSPAVRLSLPPSYHTQRVILFQPVKMDLLVVNNEWGSTSEITGMNMTNEVYVMHLCSVTARPNANPTVGQGTGHVTIDTKTHIT